MNSSLSRVLDFSATQTHPRVSDDDISFLLRRSHGRSTWSHQGNLPPLPLPSLEETIGRFLKTVRPFANGNEAAMARMEEKARRFLRSDDAARRQRRLQALASASENWLSDMWVYGAYHSYRASLMLNSNVVGFPFDWRGSRTMWERDAPAFAVLGLPSSASVQPWMAAAWTISILQYRLDLEAHRVSANQGRKQLMCMDQYRLMFANTRIPGSPSDGDFFAHYSMQSSMHIAVTCCGRLYRVQVMRRLHETSVSSEPAIVAMEDLAAAFAWVVQDARKGAHDSSLPGVGILTTMDRDSWYEARRILQSSSEANRAALGVVESAAFLVCLDDGSEPVLASDGSGRGGRCRRMLGGDGVGMHARGGNRWMDKSFQLIVDEDGNGGSNIEHSWSEAPVPLDMFLRKAFRLVRVIVEEQKRKAREGELGAAARARIDQAVVEAYHDINKSRFPFFYEDTIASETKYRYSRGTPPTPTPIVFDLTAAPSLQRTITKASAAAIKALDDSDLVTRLVPQFSKETLKALGESPDAIVQMAFQLARRRLHGDTVGTYETIGMTQWAKGRTECCRVVSDASVAFVDAVVAGAPKHVVAALLRAACKEHLRQLKAGARGEGVDRHLLGLRLQGDAAAKLDGKPHVARQGGLNSRGTWSTGSDPELFKDSLAVKSSTWYMSTSNNSYITLDEGWGAGFGAVHPDGYGICYYIDPRFIFLQIESKKSSKNSNSMNMAESVVDALATIHDVLVSSASKL